MKHDWKAVIYFTWPIYPVLRLHRQRSNWSQKAVAAAWETSKEDCVCVKCCQYMLACCIFSPLLWLLLEILVTCSILTTWDTLISTLYNAFTQIKLFYHAVIRWLKHYTTWSQLNTLAQQLADVTEVVFVHSEVRICFTAALRTIFRSLVSRITMIRWETKCNTGAPSWHRTSVTICLVSCPLHLFQKLGNSWNLVITFLVSVAFSCQEHY